MAKKPKTEYRVVCQHFGTRGHTTHSWIKGNRKKAEQSVIDLNHHVEIHPRIYYSDEAPYVIQEREVQQWENSE